MNKQKIIRILNLSLAINTLKFIQHIHIWRPHSLSELTPMISNIGLTHLGLEASIYDEAENPFINLKNLTMHSFIIVMIHTQCICIHSVNLFDYFLINKKKD